MLGCDCIKSVDDCSFSTSLTKAFPFLVTWDLDEVANKLKENTRFDMTTEHKIRLSKYVALLTFCPTTNAEHELKPLKNMMIDDDSGAWGQMIGFGQSPLVALKVIRDVFKEASLLVNSHSMLTADALCLSLRCLPATTIE